MLGSLVEIPTISVTVPITEEGGYLKSSQISNILSNTLLSAENTFSYLSISLLRKREIVAKNFNKNNAAHIIPYFTDFQTLEPLNKLSLIIKNDYETNENYISNYEILNESINIILNYLKENTKENTFSINENEIESEVHYLLDTIKQIIDTEFAPAVKGITELTHEVIQTRSANSPENNESKMRVYHLIEELRKKVKDLEAFVSLQITDLKDLQIQSIEKEILRDDIIKECKSAVENIKNTLDKQFFGEGFVKVDSLITQIQSNTIPQIEYHLQQKKIEKTFIRPLLLMHGRFRVLKKIYFIMNDKTTFEQLDFPETLEYPLSTEPDINRRISLQMIKNQEWIQKTLNTLEAKRKIMCDAYYGASRTIQKNISEEVRECLTGRALRETVLEWKQTCGDRFETPFRLNINPEIYFSEYLEEQKTETFFLIFNQIFPIPRPQQDNTNLGKRKPNFLKDPNAKRLFREGI